MRRIFEGFFTTLHEYLLSPTKILWVCAVLIVLNLVLDGSLFRLWKLHRDHDQLILDLANLKNQSVQLRTQLTKAKDPEFMEREARDRFDLVNEGDLVFVFADN